MKKFLFPCLLILLAFKSAYPFSKLFWMNCGRVWVGDNTIRLFSSANFICPDQNCTFSQWQFDTLKGNSLNVSLGSTPKPCDGPIVLFAASTGYTFHWAYDEMTNQLKITNDTSSYTYEIVSHTATELVLQKK